MMRLMEGVEITRTPRIAAALNDLKQRVSAKAPDAQFLETIHLEPLSFNLAIFVAADLVEGVREDASEALVDLIVEDFEDPLPISISVNRPEPYDPARHGQLYAELSPTASAQ